MECTEQMFTTWQRRYQRYEILLKELQFVSRKLSFVIRLDLHQLKPSSIIFGFLLLRWCLSSLENYYFKVSFNLKEIRKKIRKMT